MTTPEHDPLALHANANGNAAAQGPQGLVPQNFAEKAMASLMQLHSELMEEKERRVDLHRRLMEKEQAVAELKMYVRMLEEKLGAAPSEAASTRAGVAEREVSSRFSAAPAARHRPSPMPAPAPASTPAAPTAPTSTPRAGAVAGTAAASSTRTAPESSPRAAPRAPAEAPRPPAVARPNPEGWKVW